MRLLALCWIGFVMVFFTFSTTQEYYSMPTYPALALLLGCAMASETVGCGADCGWRARSPDRHWRDRGDLCRVWKLPSPGDISRALTQNPDLYTLSLGHMGDLTIASFAYLRLPLALAGVAFLIGAVRVPRGAEGAAGAGADDGAVPARGATGDGDVRSVPGFAAAGGGVEEVARGRSDY